MVVAAHTLATDALPPDACARFAANLDALARRQPKLAAQLSSVSLPPSARITTGRDGSPVARLADTADYAGWLGGTSMPTISAPEVLLGAVEGAASVALASIGSGYEAPLLADRLAAYTAVFVCAPDVAALALALHVVDWSRGLHSGRIVILAGDLESSLVTFMEKHPGYQVPARAQSLPDVARADFVERTAAIQRGAQRADAAQQQAITRLVEQIGRMLARRNDTKPGGPSGSGQQSAPVGESASGHLSAPDRMRSRVLMVALEARSAVAEFAAQAENAMSAMGFSIARCVPDAPDQCHAVARLAAVRDHHPDWVFLINCTPRAAFGAVPWSGDLPCACWFLEGAALPPLRESAPGLVRSGLVRESSLAPPAVLAGVADCKNLYAASTTVRAQLLACGADANAVEVLEPGVDDTVFRKRCQGPFAAKRPEGCSAQKVPDTFSCASAACDIAVFADGCDLDPAAANIGLESHERLWNAAAELLAKGLRAGQPTPGPGAADALLARAERATGIKLHDAALRREFAALLASRLIGTVVARECIAALCSIGRVGLWGAGWVGWDTRERSADQRSAPVASRSLPSGRGSDGRAAAVNDLAGLYRGRVPDAAARNRIYQDTAVVAFPQAGPASARSVLEVLAAGGCPVTARVSRDELARYPQCGQILSAVPTFTNLSDLVGTVRRLLSDTACRRNATQPPRDELLRNHTLRSRLSQLCEKLTAPRE
jgi:hypothetical protein